MNPLCADPRIQAVIDQHLPKNLQAFFRRHRLSVLHCPHDLNNALGWTDYSKVPGETILAHVCREATTRAMAAITFGAMLPPNPSIEDLMAEQNAEADFEMSMGILTEDGPLNGLPRKPGGSPVDPSRGNLDGSACFGMYDCSTNRVLLDADHVDDYTVIHEMGHAFDHYLYPKDIHDADAFSTTDATARSFFAQDKPSGMYQTGDDDRGARQEWFADIFARYYGLLTAANPRAHGRDLHPETKRWLGKVIGKALRSQAAA